MITLAKILEALAPKDWIVHGQTVKKISEHELVSVVITLTANHIHNHEKRPAWRTIREIATALQDISKAEMLIRAFEGKSGEVILSKVKESLTLSMAEDDMCPANTLVLYSKDEQSRILEKTMDQEMRVNVLKKYCSRWHPTPKQWRT